MKYMGSKNRHAKELLEVMLPFRKEGQIWVEPFVGGANMVDKVGGQRLGNDINEDLIHMWWAVQKGWEPPEIVSEELYDAIRHTKFEDTLERALYAFVAIGCSYSGKWWGGYARGKDNH